MNRIVLVLSLLLVSCSLGANEFDTEVEISVTGNDEQASAAVNLNGEYVDSSGPAGLPFLVEIPANIGDKIDVFIVYYKPGHAELKSSIEPDYQETRGDSVRVVEEYGITVK